MTSTAALETLLGDWRKLLSDWASSGQITAAATEALKLDGEPELLKKLVGQWSKGDFSGLPPIILLPSSSMPGAAGAYAISTGTIYLNQDWLKTASHDWIMGVLTEELGHHLDGLLNAVDTPGDEGERFAQVLKGIISKGNQLYGDDDNGLIQTGAQVIAAELATQYTGPWFLSSSTDYVGPYQPQELPNRDLFSWADSDQIYVKAVKEGGAFVFTLNGPTGNYDRIDWSVGGQSGTLAKGNNLSTPISIPSNETQGDDRLDYVNLRYYNSTFNGVFALYNRFAFGIKDTSVASSSLPVISFGASPQAVREDASRGMGFYLNRSGSTSDPLTVNYTIGGSATNGTDYIAIPTSVTFAAGSSSTIVKIEPIADSEVEPDETVELTISTGDNYAIDKLYKQTHRIYNDDITITLEVSPEVVKEDEGNELVYVFTRSPGGDNDELLVSYEVEGSAVLDTDYAGIWSTESPKIVRFAPGHLSTVVRLKPIEDGLVESDETIALSLLAGSGYTIGTSDAVTGTIADDDVPLASVTLAASPSSVTEDGTDSLTYTFTRSGDISNPLTVNYTVGGTARLVGTSTDPADYSFVGSSSTTTTRSVTFAASSATATVVVDPTVDTRVESDETIVLTLAAGTGYTIGTPGEVTGTILDRVFNAPTDLRISPSTFDENIPAGTAVGSLTSSDPDSEDSFTYSLVSGAGSTDNGAFTIDGEQLKINASPDYETKSYYSIRVRTTDSGNLSHEKILEFTVNDLEEKDSYAIQQIKPTSELITYRPGTSVALPLVYSTSDNDLGLSGLTLNIHHDSQRLSPITVNNGITDQLQADAVTATTIQADASDLDDSALTDQMIQVSWGFINNSFPGIALPSQVVVANFDTNSDAYDPITGAPVSTTINFTASETSSNYGFEGTPVTLVPESFHLDIDGDGRTTALGDGLMVIRKLFGTAFAGDALTNKAASFNAAVDTKAMHHWLEAGIASGNLDVDKDGKTTALGDGLMVIRYMFGSAFTGDALIEKAISNSSPYAGQSNAAEMVRSNIESLMNIL